ncbi:MAG TPA: hypothetical protein VM938_05205 [Acidimicrobiales bacterium]|nr:hypothetical protein [Acidimicrobiales bacterium]
MRRTAAVVALVLVVGACSRGKPKQSADGDLLTPQFAPDTSTTLTTTADGVMTTTRPGAPGATTTPSTGASGQQPAPVVPGATTAALVDPRGDLTPSPLDPPPAWADLVGATLLRRADGFELRVRLGGGSAPTGTDEDHTMNIASFYDVDGNGSVDYEVWANLAASGWGGSWFDNRAGKAAFADKARVAVTVAGDEVVLRFPLSHLGNAEQFRWSLASEWGRYEVLGTAATARDDAPDNDGAARFPG